MNAPPLQTDPVFERRVARAAANFRTAAFLHKQAQDELLVRVDLLRLQPRRILDLSGGLGSCAKALARRFPKASVTFLDPSPTVLRAAHKTRGWWQRFDCARAQAPALPLEDASVDLVVAGLLLPQWQDCSAVLESVRRVLKPRGYFAFTTLGAPTLREVAAAFAVADPQRRYIYEFMDFHDLGDALTRSGFVAPVLDTDRLTVTYRSLRDVCRDLRAGAAALPVPSRKTLTGSRRWRAAEAAFERDRGADGRVPVTCELVYGQAWAPDGEAVPRRTGRREVVVPLTGIRPRAKS